MDLQCVKAGGVTFAVSAIERVIEERAKGVPGKAQEIREQLAARIGTDIRKVVPGSPEAQKLKDALIADGVWSQYLEVAIGPDAEVFTKAPPLSSVGWGDYVGIRTQSTWNNPEPEIVVVVDRAGKTVGATLGNDVNLRDYEGRSALLLGKAKDNNAASALGPFIRMFDDKFTIDDVRKAVVELEIVGTDNYRLEGRSSMSEISRDPAGAGEADHQRAPVSRRLCAVPGHPVRPHPGPRRQGLGLHPQGRRCGADLHPQAGRAGEPGHHLQGGAALEFRHFRPDEKPCPAWAFRRLRRPAAYTPTAARDAVPGWPRVGLRAPKPLNTAGHFLAPFPGEI